MKIAKNKTAAIAIALLLMLSMSASIMLAPTTTAHTPPWSYPTYAYLSVSPNPVGVGQTVTVNFFIDKVPPNAVNIFGERWHGFRVTITKPDGTSETKGPYDSDAAGGAWFPYTPDTVGNYTLVFNFPGQVLTGENPSPITGNINPQDVNDTFLPSTSQKMTLVVQQEPVTGLPTNPLPTNYWTRPIEAYNINWYTLGGDWLQGGTYNVTTNFNPYTKGPTTGHIMWTKSYSAGGLIGGTYGGTSQNSNYMSTNQYQTKITPIIMDGIYYYQLYPGATQSTAGWVALDLRTGQTIWTMNTTATLKCGQIMQFESPNQRGGIPYLWANPMKYTNLGANGSAVIMGGPNTQPPVLQTNVLQMFDAMTGDWILNVVGVPGMTTTFDKIGSLIGYYINNTSPQGIYGSQTLNMWNSTLAIMNYGWDTRQNYNPWIWQPPQGGNISFAYGIQWTVPLVTNMTADNGTIVNINALYQADTGLIGSNPGDTGTPSSYPLAIDKVSDVILVDNGASGGRFQEPGYIISEGYSPDTGALVWGPTKNTIPPWCRTTTGCVGDGIYATYVYETQSFYAYSLATGQKLWGPVSTGVANNPFGYYVDTSYIAYGNIYLADYGGNVFCINDQTGAIKWKWDTGISGYQTPYGVYPLVNFHAIADGMIYVGGGHLYSPPIFDGARLYCINATSGDLIWDMPSFAISNAGRGAIADGYLVVPNAYDNQLYCYGMGPCKVTVTAPDVGVTTATPITIRGTVTDIASGSQQDEVAANFPNGLPCVSDASMTGWMEYVYMQQPCPAIVTGVPVDISVLDSNGNYRSIGTATSDGSGMFTFTWTPDIPGDFTVVATFAGSESYYPSNAETSFTVSAPAPTASPYPTVNLPPTEMYVVGMGIAIIIAIAIVGFLILRKHP